MTEGDTLHAALLEPGYVIANRYRLERLIGTGGMGSVYVAANLLESDRRVAVKVLHREHVINRSYVERFIREMELMERVDHPNVVKTYDFGTYGDIVYLTMEYVPGHSLAYTIEHGEPIPDLGSLVLEVCEGLDAIHRADIIHRDLKPANILIAPDSTVKITDFGVARPKVSRLTGRNQKVGSILYMAPEIWQARELTPAVDFYALGVMLYEVVTGQPPFDHENPAELAQLHIKDIPVPPIQRNLDVPRWLDALIMILLAKSPRDRLDSAEKVSQFINLHSPSSKSRAKLPRISTLSQPYLLQVDPVSGKVNTHRRSATVVLELTATRKDSTAPGERSDSGPKQGKTIVFNLPRGAAVVLELEIPSRDFIYFGLFFVSLQICDGILTSYGMKRFGITAEGNPFLRTLMLHMGPHEALVAMKTVSVLFVVLLTIIAKRVDWIKNLIGVLSCIYLIAAILPWCYLLFVKQHSG